MNSAMNVQPEAGHGNGSVRTHHQPSWSPPSSPCHSSSSSSSVSSNSSSPRSMDAQVSELLGTLSGGLCFTSAVSTLDVNGRSYAIQRIDGVPGVERLPYTLRILLENVLRNGGDGDALASWEPQAEPSREISFAPGRVLLQDFTGVPAVVDLAAMRDAIAELGGDPARVNPLIPAELVIDHSVQVDLFGSRLAFARNVELELERNRERYAFLRWGQ